MRAGPQVQGDGAVRAPQAPQLPDGVQRGDAAQDAGADADEPRGHAHGRAHDAARVRAVRVRRAAGAVRRLCGAAGAARGGREEARGGEEGAGEAGARGEGLPADQGLFR